MGAVERQMEMIKVLCLRRHETMGNLAFEFGVSLRTVQRDITVITSIIPIYIKMGRYGGGIYVMDHFQLGNVHMDKNEILLMQKIRCYFFTVEKEYLDGAEKELLEKIIYKYMTLKN